MVDSTLRHELVHQWTVRNPVLGPVSRFLYNRSAMWTYSEEAVAETQGSGSLAQGLMHPIVNPYLTPSMFAFDAAVIGGGAAAGYGIYEWSR